MRKNLLAVVLCLLLSAVAGAATIAIDGEPDDWTGKGVIYENLDNHRGDYGIKRIWVTHDEEYLYFRIDWRRTKEEEIPHPGWDMVLDTDSIALPGRDGFKQWVLPAKGFRNGGGTCWGGLAITNGSGNWKWEYIEQNMPTELYNYIKKSEVTFSEFRVRRSVWNLLSDDFVIRFAFRVANDNDTAPGTGDYNYTGNPQYPEGYFTYSGSPAAAEGAGVSFGSPMEERGLYLGLGTGGKTIFDQIRDARRTDLKTGNDSFYLSLSRTFFQGLTSGTDFEVEYYDEGTTPFQLEYYDAQGQRQVSPQIFRGNTLTWKRASFRLLDFAAGGGLGGNDLRIMVDSSDQEQDLYVRSVAAKGFAQGGLRVTVADQVIGVPLPQAKLTVSSTEYENVVFSAETDNAGAASIGDLPEGSYRVKIDAMGYSTQERELTVTENETVQQAFELTRPAGSRIVIDGDPDDWVGNVRIYEHQDNGKGEYGIQRVWVTHDAEYLYFRIDWRQTGKFADPRPGWDMMVDTDSVNTPGRENFRQWVLPAKGFKNGGGTVWGGLATSNGAGGWNWFYIEREIPSEMQNYVTEPFTEFRIKRSVWNLLSDDFVIRFAFRVAHGPNGGDTAPGTGNYQYTGEAAYPEGYYVYSPKPYGSLRVSPRELSARGDSKVAIGYSLQEAVFGTVKIFAPDGSLVKTLAEEEPQLGAKTYSWEPRLESGAPLPDGLYRIAFQFATATDKRFEESINVKLVSAAPNQPIITYPLASGEHNLDWISLKGRTELAGDGLLSVEVNGAPAEVMVRGELLEKVPILKDGTFLIDAVYLQPGVNNIALCLADRYGNPSEKTEPLAITYNPDAVFGMLEIPYASISPANGDGIQDEFVIRFNAANAIEPELAIFQGETEVARIGQSFDPGLVRLAWDGKRSGQFVPDGDYRFVLTVADQPPVEGVLRVKNTPPATPELVWPNEGKSLSAADVSLQWGTVRDAVAYRVTYGRNADLSQAESERVSGASLELTNLDGGSWYWKVEAIDEAGNLSRSEVHSFEIGSLDSSVFAVKNLGLAPNPFSPGRQSFRGEVKIGFTLTQRGTVRIEIYNLRGRRLHTGSLGELTAGEHVAVWNGRDDSGGIVPQGSYIVRVVAESPVHAPRIAAAKRMVVVLY